LLARDKLFEVRLVERAAQSYDSPDVLLAWLRGQFWIEPNGPKDRRLQTLLAEHAESRDGRVALNWTPGRIGVVTWHG
jgi:hypothetical protein